MYVPLPDSRRTDVGERYMTDADRVIWRMRYERYTDDELERVIERCGVECRELAERVLAERRRT